MDTQAKNQERFNLLSRAADELFEHATCVAVMASFDEGERKDECFYVFRGSSLAAVGLADEFITIRRRERGPLPPAPPR